MDIQQWRSWWWMKCGWKLSLEIHFLFLWMLRWVWRRSNTTIEFIGCVWNRLLSKVVAIADDLEVKKADDEAAYLNKCYREVTQWNDVPFTPKLLLQTSVACIVTSCYIFQLFSSLCFTEHTLTDSIDDNLQGNVGNLFLPLGWVATGLFIASVLLLYFFISWGKRHARHLVNATAPKPEEEAGYGSTNHLTDIDLHQQK